MSTIGSRVKALRLARGLKQSELAKRIGIAAGSLSLIESDTTKVPAGDTLAALCRELQTTQDFILAGQGDSNTIAAAIDESELVHVWRDLPEDARRLVLEHARSTAKAFKPKTRA